MFYVINVLNSFKIMSFVRLRSLTTSMCDLLPPTTDPTTDPMTPPHHRSIVSTVCVWAISEAAPQAHQQRYRHCY